MLKFCVFLQRLQRRKEAQLCSTGKARDTVTYINTEAFGKENGVDVMFKKLDEVFLKDKITFAYMAFKQLCNFRSTAGTSINQSEFILEFERYYNDMKKYDMKLPDGIIAFKILNAVG